MKPKRNLFMMLLFIVCGCTEFFGVKVISEASLITLSSPQIVLKDPLVAISLDPTPEFTITGIEVGATITLYSDACVTKVAEAVASAASIDLTSSALSKGEYKFYVRQRTATGISACNVYADYQLSGTPMVSVWQTSAPSETITLPLPTGFRYNLLVDWGDGTPNSLITAFDDTDISHSFASSGAQTITIMGTAEAWSFNNAGDKLKLYQVTELGDLNWKSFDGAFFGCLNLSTFSGGVTDQVTDMKQMFRRTPIAVPDTSGWNTSAVTNMYGMFYEASSATPDTSNWDTTSVTNMSAMFTSALVANPDTAGWVTSSVTDMSSMFWNAPSAHPDTSGWDTSKVLSMAHMFRQTTTNPNTTNWNTSAVQNMDSMFANATNANPDTSNWNTSEVTTMNNMFRAATNAQPNTTNWNTSKVKLMTRMFWGATNANPNTTNWNTSEVTEMYYMFYQATSANPNTANWNTSKLTNTDNMFFAATAANPDVTNWNTSLLVSAQGMFQSATSANPNFSNWNFANVTSMVNMLSGATSFSTTNYSNMLNRIVATSAQTGVSLHAGSAKYNVGASAARATLVGNGWVITDGGAE